MKKQAVKIEYTELNARQKETYNFHKIAARLSDFGFNSIKLSDDWEGADFISIHKDGHLILKVQLKGRFHVDKKYLNKEIFVAFSDRTMNWYLYPHDKFYRLVMKKSNGARKNSGRSMGKVPKWLAPHLQPYRLSDNKEILLLEQ